MAIDLATAVQQVRCDRPPLICIHGGPGIGKTTFGAAIPDAVFIRCEDGLGSLTANAFPIADSFDAVMEQLEALRTQNHAYRAVVIDTLSSLEPMIWAKVVGIAGARSKSDRAIKALEDIGYGKGYAMALDFWQAFLGLCHQLIRERSMYVVLLAHSDIVRHEPPDSDGYDRTQIKLHKRAFQLVYEQCDIIGYAAPEVFIRKEEVSKDRKRNMAISGGRRLLHLVEQAAHIAKNRYRLPPIIELSWPAFNDALIQAITPK